MSENLKEYQQMEENLNTLKEMFANMTKVVKQLELDLKVINQKNVNHDKINKSLLDASNRLLMVNDKQQSKLTSLGESLTESLDQIQKLNAKIEDLKKENLELKASFNNDHQSGNCSSVGSQENYLLKKKADLEKELMFKETYANVQVYECNKEVTKYKLEVAALLKDNKSLKEQLVNFRNFHNQVISEIQLKNLNNANGVNQQGKNNSVGSILSKTSELSNPNTLHPIHMNVIESDVEENSFITTDALINSSF